MALVEETLFGTVDRVAVAIARLQEFCPDEGYYVAFSGGKDSVAIYALCEKAKVKFDAHYNLTTVDPPELVQFIRLYYPEVEIHYPELSMWRLIEKKKIPPTRRMRYCCEVLKEGGGHGRRVVTGVRWAESARRKNTRRMVQTCFKDGTKTYISPIIDWTDEDVWQFIKSNGEPYCKLYDKGFKRLGCIMCPLASVEQREFEAQMFPKYYQAYLRTFGRMLKRREEQGRTTRWKTAEDVMKWWIYEIASDSEDNVGLFE